MPDTDKAPADEKLLILPLDEESKKITQIISNDTARQIIELLADSPLSASDIAERLRSPISTIAYNLENLESVGLIKIEKIKYSRKGREVKIYGPVRKLIVVVPGRTDKNSVAEILKKYAGMLVAAAFASSLIELFMRYIGGRAKMVKIAGDGLIESPTARSIVPFPETTSMPAAALNDTVKGVSSGGTVVPPAATPMPTAAAESIPAAALNNTADGAVSGTVTAPMVTTVPAGGPESVPFHLITTPAPTAVPPLPEGNIVSQAAPESLLAKTVDMIIAHPGLMFFFGCLFIVVLLAIIEHNRRK